MSEGVGWEGGLLNACRVPPGRVAKKGGSTLELSKAAGEPTGCWSCVREFI